MELCWNIKFLLEQLQTVSQRTRESSSKRESRMNAYDEQLFNALQKQLSTILNGSGIIEDLSDLIMKVKLFLMKPHLKIVGR